MLASDLRETLVVIVDAMRHARDPWWVISSAAVALHGVAPIEVDDVDVLMSVGDARRVMDRLGVVPIEDGASAMFRSTLFGRWEAPPLVVEIMAGFYVATGSGWTEVLPRTRVPILWMSAWFMCLTVLNWPRCLGCSDVQRTWSELGF